MTTPEVGLCRGLWCHVGEQLLGTASRPGQARVTEAVVSCGTSRLRTLLPPALPGRSQTRWWQAGLQHGLFVLSVKETNDVRKKKEPYTPLRLTLNLASLAQPSLLSSHCPQVRSVRGAVQVTLRPGSLLFLEQPRGVAHCLATGVSPSSHARVSRPSRGSLDLRSPRLSDSQLLSCSGTSRVCRPRAGVEKVSPSQPSASGCPESSGTAWQTRAATHGSWVRAPTAWAAAQSRGGEGRPCSWVGDPSRSLCQIAASALMSGYLCRNSSLGLCSFAADLSLPFVHSFLFQTHSVTLHHEHESRISHLEAVLGKLAEQSEVIPCGQGLQQQLSGRDVRRLRVPTPWPSRAPQGVRCCSLRNRERFCLFPKFSLSASAYCFDAS